MNRFHQIKSVALRAVGGDADKADALIELVGLMISAVGKGVAIEGDASLNEAVAATFDMDTMSIGYSDREIAEKEAEFEAECAADRDKAHNRYLVGERIQSEAVTVVSEARAADVTAFRTRGGETFTKTTSDTCPNCGVRADVVAGRCLYCTGDRPSCCIPGPTRGHVCITDTGHCCFPYCEVCEKHG